MKKAALLLALALLLSSCGAKEGGDSSESATSENGQKAASTSSSVESESEASASSGAEAASEGAATRLDPDQALSVGYEVVRLIDARDSEGLRALFDETMQATMTDDVLNAVYEQIKDKGSLGDFGQSSVSEMTDEKTGKTYSVVIVEGKYAAASILFTISVDEEGRVAGLYFR
ncbi:MAG: DUF3887 domain-containing protein [Ndongobacter sp.]|nr:DUF3887 domain-containing protein [Ndongobacter sp.]